MFIKENSEEIPNSKEAMSLCMAYLWENVIEPSNQEGIISPKNYDMIEEIGRTLTIIGKKLTLTKDYMRTTPMKFASKLKNSE